jgi:hypothetical protein
LRYLLQALNTTLLEGQQLVESKLKLFHCLTAGALAGWDASSESESDESSSDLESDESASSELDVEELIAKLVSSQLRSASDSAHYPHGSMYMLDFTLRDYQSMIKPQT